MGELRAHVDGADSSQRERCRVEVIQTLVQAGLRAAGHVQLEGMEVAGRRAGPEPRPPPPAVAEAGHARGEVEEASEHHQVNRGGPGRRVTAGQDVERHRRFPRGSKLDGQRLVVKAPIPLERRRMVVGSHGPEPGHQVVAATGPRRVRRLLVIAANDLDTLHTPQLTRGSRVHHSLPVTSSRSASTGPRERGPPRRRRARGTVHRASRRPRGRRIRPGRRRARRRRVGPRYRPRGLSTRRGRQLLYHHGRSGRRCAPAAADEREVPP
jgi:hypothetical protein